MSPVVIAELLDGIGCESTDSPASSPSTMPASATAKPSRSQSVVGSPHRCTTLYFDLETVPDESRLAQFNLQPLPTLPPPIPMKEMMSPAEFVTQTLDVCKGWFKTHHPCEEWVDQVEQAEMENKKPRAGLFEVLASHREKAQTIADAAADRNKLLSVTPEFNRIVALGWALDGGETQALLEGPQPNGWDASEAVLLEHFWHLASKSKILCGYNVLGFDLPTIYIRSALLGVKPSRLIDLKPWGGEVIDLLKVRHPAGIPNEGQTGKPSRLKTVARVLGLDVMADEVEGSQVMDLYLNDREKLAQYVKSDVSLCQQLREFYRGYFV